MITKTSSAMNLLPLLKLNGIGFISKELVLENDQKVLIILELITTRNYFLALTFLPDLTTPKSLDFCDAQSRFDDGYCACHNHWIGWEEEALEGPRQHKISEVSSSGKAKGYLDSELELATKRTKP